MIATRPQRSSGPGRVRASRGCFLTTLTGRGPGVGFQVTTPATSACTLPPDSRPGTSSATGVGDESQRMTAYIVRRILFMIPTIFGIMLVSFVVVQFAPGGPVERVIAQLSGSDTGATSRISGSAERRFLRARRACRAAPSSRVNSKYRGAQGLDPEFIKSLEKQFGFDKPAYERFFIMLWNYLRFDFGKSYFRDVQRPAPDQGEAAGLDLARHLDDAAELPDLDPARHPQGGARRLAVRRLDLGRHHRRLRHPGLPVRDPAHRAVRRRLVLQDFSAARPRLRRLVAILLVAQDPRLLLAPHAADRLHGARRLRHHDAADQELLPRGDSASNTC